VKPASHAPAKPSAAERSSRRREKRPEVIAPPQNFSDVGKKSAAAISRRLEKRPTPKVSRSAIDAAIRMCRP
jgi:hypothetical protein